jgi:predicted transcriptional regulator
MGRAEAVTIEILRENGQAYQSDLVRATGFSRATISATLADLERRRLVRISTEGRNSRVIYLARGRTRGLKKKKLILGFTRSAEYPFLVQVRKALLDSGIELGFRVYDNGVDVARDLAAQRIDIGIAPLVTLFVMHSLDAPFKIIGPAGSGGSSLLKSPRQLSARDSNSSDGGGSRRGRMRMRLNAICTRLSTMEVLMRTAESRHDITEIGELTYADSPAEIESALMSGRADVCTIWEPYATLLEARGAKRVVRYSEVSEHVCCVAAVGTHLGERLLSTLSRTYAASMIAFKRDRDSSTAAYAALTGLDSAIVRLSEAEYSYQVELSCDAAISQLQAARLVVPSPSSLREALYRE